MSSAPDLVPVLEGIVDGARVLVLSTLALAVTAATWFAVRSESYGNAVCMAVFFCACALLVEVPGYALPADTVAAFVLLALGVLVAADLPLRGRAAWVGAAVGGVAAGLSGKLQTASWEESAGALGALLGISIVFGVLAQATIPSALTRPAALARRMAGAWLAAVGVLMLALWMRGNGAP